MKIVLATGNSHKVEEINLISKAQGIEFILPSTKDFNPIEDGKTFLENAYCKAKYASLYSEGSFFLADDSGLCVEALDDAPGIYSARYAPSPKERIEKLLFNMKDKKNRNAKFVCAMVLVNKKGEILFQTQGVCKGLITEKPDGQNGFGYDPIFYIPEKNMTMASLSDLEKSKTSHRSIALNEVLSWIKENKEKLNG